ncbi:MAG TPA: bestrophin family ion channel [Ramlibacter sp.]|uniref:bestrophin family protein n=1 Tax=Ramlibacter sp. TaxID=1917967 RepID=UPI002ED0024B
MHIGKSYTLPEFIDWTRRRGYVLLLLAFVSVAAYQLLGLHWLAFPWPVAALLGTAASFIVGFKNVQTYQRSMEAQQVWTAIGVLSRYWGLICRDFPKDGKGFEPLVRRHLAWLTVLRYGAREPRVWESSSSRSNVEYQKRNYRVIEREVPLENELRRLLPQEDVPQVLAAQDKSGWLLSAQSRAIRELYLNQDLVVLHHTEMQKTLKDLLDQQGRVDRIKNFPYPRQYAAIHRIFVWCFAAILPLCLVREFERLNESVGGLLAGHMAWFAVPFGVLVAWLYLALDQVGESTENPFEGNANDVPISRICGTLEYELRGLLGDADVPMPPPQDQAIIL